MHFVVFLFFLARKCVGLQPSAFVVQRTREKMFVVTQLNSGSSATMVHSEHEDAIL